MPKSSSSNSDSGPEDRNPPPKQKGKKRPVEDDSDDDDEKPKASKEKKKQKESSNDTEGFQRIKNDEGTEMIEIGKLRYVCVRDFRGKMLIDLREYYNDKSGKLMPGKKGISLSREQYENFKKLIPEIDSKLK